MDLIGGLKAPGLAWACMVTRGLDPSIGLRKDLARAIADFEDTSEGGTQLELSRSGFDIKITIPLTGSRKGVLFFIHVLKTSVQITNSRAQVEEIFGPIEDYNRTTLVHSSLANSSP